MKTMPKMTQYYLSRALISAAFGGLFAITGTPLWIAVLTGAGVFVLFL
jgi:4-hydroxybenzoate polyprenyltransferase